MIGGQMTVKRKLLLTGGRGMVGQNILEHARAQDWDIAAPSRSELDLTNAQAVTAYMDQWRPDVVVHAAGEVGGIQANMAHPVDFLVRNTDMGRNVVLAARAAGVKRLLNLSSSCMYPRDAQNPLTEDLILKGELEPTNEGYAIAKIFTTRLCQYITREDPQYHYKTLIPCNLYGRHDKFDPQRSHLVPAVIAKIHRAKTQGLLEVDIWGDGTARREFMYAGDLADAIFHALQVFDQWPDLCNVGLGHDHSIDDYYATVADVIGWSGQFVHDVSKPAGMKRKLVDVSRQTTLGWKPRTSLREGIAQTYDFYLKEAAR
jgi:GDP-L-fucose synthase